MIACLINKITKDDISYELRYILHPICVVLATAHKQK